MIEFYRKITDLEDFKLGCTYLLSDAVAKLVDTNLFGLTFLMFNSNGTITREDVDYYEMKNMSIVQVLPRR